MGSNTSWMGSESVMIHIIGTYTDNLYVSNDVEYEEDKLIILQGYKGNLQERFAGRRRVNNLVIPLSDIFFTFQCYDRGFETNRGTVDFNDLGLKRLLALPKKLAAAHLMSSTLKQTNKSLLLKQIVARWKETRVLNQTSLSVGVNEFGFLFGVAAVSSAPRGRRYKYVAED